MYVHTQLNFIFEFIYLFIFCSILLDEEGHIKLTGESTALPHTHTHTFHDLCFVLMVALSLSQISACAKKPSTTKRRLIPSAVLWSTWRPR